jgi:hypothetical protein
MDALRKDIYNNTLNSSSVIWLNRKVKQICTRQKVEFLDLTDEFDQNYQQHHRKFNSEIDGHWNEYGHVVASKVISKYLATSKVNDTEKTIHIIPYWEF